MEVFAALLRDRTRVPGVWISAVRLGGSDGIDVSGGDTSAHANRLAKNVSPGASATENGGAEFQLLNWIKNEGGGNKADNIVVPKTTITTKCTTFPATNGTSNSAIACE